MEKRDKIYYFYLLSGLIICSLVFYWRLLRKHTPHNISFEWSGWSFLLYTGLSMLLCYVILRKIWPKAKKNKPVTIFTKYILIPLSEWYSNSLQKTTETLLNAQLLKTPTKYILKTYIDIGKRIIGVTETKATVIFFILAVFPRLLIAVASSVDIIVFHKFHYLYQVLGLLLIPLAWTIFYTCMNFYHHKYMLLIEKYFTIELTFNDPEIKESNPHLKKFIAIKIVPKEGVETSKENKEILKNLYLTTCVFMETGFIGVFNLNGSLANKNPLKTLIIVTDLILLMGFAYMVLKLGENLL